MDPIPLSALNHYLFCSRRAVLIHGEGLFVQNAHTTLGNLTHEHTDLPGYEAAKGVVLLRALPVHSRRLGLSGKCDIVERRPDGSYYPVEYKKGRRRVYDNVDAQLCAQAMCLEEMLGTEIGQGAVFHAENKRRREVAFDVPLRRLVESAAAGLRALLEARTTPPAELLPRCEGCSLRALCLPELTNRVAAAGCARASEGLFEVEAGQKKEC